jgi:hypothetical protein
VLGPDGLSRFEELSRRQAADTAILYAFDLIEHDGQDIRNLPFLDRKAALARVLHNTKAGILFNEHIVEDGPVVFTHACRLGAEPSSCRRRSTASIDPARAVSGSRRGARFGISDDRRLPPRPSLLDSTPAKAFGKSR